MIFLFEFKMDSKAAETAHIINNVFGPGIANEHRVHRVRHDWIDLAVAAAAVVGT